MNESLGNLLYVIRIICNQQGTISQVQRASVWPVICYDSAELVVVEYLLLERRY